MKKLLTCGLVCVLALATTTAQALVTLDWDITQNAATAPDGTVLSKWVGTLSSDGGNIIVIDCGTPAVPGIIAPQLYQNWLYGAVPTTAIDTVHNGASPAVDSHFLFNLADLSVVQGRELTEDSTSVLGTPIGWGTRLGGTFSLAPAVRSTSLDFVQLYVPSGGNIDFYIKVAEVGGPGGIFASLPNGPPVLVSDSALNFGVVRIGTTDTETLTVSNRWTSDEILSGTFPAASGEFGPGGTNTFNYLWGSDSDDRQYTYTPTDRVSDAQVITVTSNGGDADVTLSGTGVGPVFDSSSDPESTLDFDEVLAGTPESIFLDVSNITTDNNFGSHALTNLTLLDFSISGDDAALFDIVGFSPNTVLYKDGTLSLELRYNGTGTPGMADALLTLSTDEGAALGGNGSDFNYNISANVVPEPTTLCLLGLGGLAILLIRRRGNRGA